MQAICENCKFLSLVEIEGRSFCTHPENVKKIRAQRVPLAVLPSCIRGRYKPLFSVVSLEWEFLEVQPTDTCEHYDAKKV